MQAPPGPPAVRRTPKPSTLKKKVLRARRDQYLAHEAERRQQAERAQQEQQQEEPAERNQLAEPGRAQRRPETGAADDADVVDAGDDDDAVLDAVLAGGTLETGASAGPGTDDSGDDLMTPAERLEELRRYPPITLSAPREYCDQVLDRDLDALVKKFLEKLKYFQDRQLAINPVKARQRRRLVVGLRQVARFVRAGRARGLIMAPNAEPVPGPGGLDEHIHGILAAARQHNTPVVYAMTKRSLGRTLHLRSPATAVAILMADGALDMWRDVLLRTEKLRAAWQPPTAAAPAVAAATTAATAVTPSAGTTGDRTAGRGGVHAPPPKSS